MNARERSGAKKRSAREGAELGKADRRALRAVELMFYAYRDFTADADALLAQSGFGRAHHRALHFVGRSPGMTVTELLEVLRITKQSLNRVLQQLVSEDYVRQEPGPEDRRQRRLFLTDTGEEMWRALRTPQFERFQRAYREVGTDAAPVFEAVLEALLNDDEREEIVSRVRRS